MHRVYEPGFKVKKLGKETELASATVLQISPGCTRYHRPHADVVPLTVGVGTGATAVGVALGFLSEVAPKPEGNPPLGLMQIDLPTKDEIS